MNTIIFENNDIQAKNLKDGDIYLELKMPKMVVSLKDEKYSVDLQTGKIDKIVNHEVTVKKVQVEIRVK